MSKIFQWNEVEAVLSKAAERPVTITGTKPLPGGSINQAAALTTTAGKYFIKWNSAEKYPGMFETEVKGLELLRSANALYIPGVVHSGTVGTFSFLILELVEAGKKEEDFWEDFARSLAKQHRHSHERFGLDHDNYIGSLHQSNTLHNSWSEFFTCERLEPQLRLARNEGKIGRSISSRFENLFSALDEIFPSEKPALLHGDLWSGNYMTSPQGRACIYDPAVYYGHREMDIAMTRMFGGFSQELYDCYHNTFPLEKGWEQRIAICNLYPLLVHVNLFGGGYISEVEQVLRKF